MLLHNLEDLPIPSTAPDSDANPISSSSSTSQAPHGKEITQLGKLPPGSDEDKAQWKNPPSSPTETAPTKPTKAKKRIKARKNAPDDAASTPSVSSLSGGPTAAPGRFDELLRPITDLVLLRPSSPFRLLDYRWQLALHLVNKTWFPRKWVDPTVREAGKFVKALRRCRSDVDFLRLSEREPDAFEALTLRTKQHPRWEVEARVLADEPVERIAEKMHMTAEMITTYERWFFPVRHLLQHRSWIIHEVIRWHTFDGDPDIAAQWKRTGFRGGPLILDVLFGIANEDSIPRSTQEIGAYVAADVKHTTATKAMTGASLMHVDGKSGHRIVKFYLQQLSAETKPIVKNPLPVDFAKNMAAYFAGLVREGPHPLEGKLPPPLRPKDTPGDTATPEAGPPANQDAPATKVSDIWE